MNKRIATHVGLILLMTLLLGFFDLPYARQSQIMPSTPESFEMQKIHLGLDLQGGTQLDYKIDLRKVEEVDREQIIEGVMEVITRRVNGLGVAEPNIYRSQVADEEHIIVELAGIQDIEEAKETVGKTIQLEFKETNNEPVTQERLDEIEAMAQTSLDRILAGEDFDLVAQEEELANSGLTIYFTGIDEATGTNEYGFKDGFSTDYFPYLDEMEIGSVAQELIYTSDGYTYDAYGTLNQLEGYYLIKLLDRRKGEREYHEDKKVEASHVLIAYTGSGADDGTVTRTKEEALELAEEIQDRAEAGEDFSELVKEYSDEGAAATTGGDLGFFGPGVMVKDFEDAAFSMEIGDISEVVETEFGYHIIYVTDIQEATTETVTETEYSVAKIYYSTLGDPWKSTELTGEHFVRADVVIDPNTYAPYISIEFDEEGALLFEELTSRNIGQPIAIFVGGSLISAPNVNETISGGQAQITGQFTIEEASDLARDLNTGAIPAPVLLVGQYTIGASLGQDALETSLQAGIIGLVLLALYMLLYYRLPGLIANIALVIYASILLFVIKVTMPLTWALTFAVILFCVVVYAILKNRDSGWEKMISFLLACFVLVFATYLLATPVVLTLAGIAGVILSIGMAVDANILIFERMREELRNGRPLSGAIEVGFDRAWSSIRDSNFSSLITCAILMYFGSSIIQGFAVNLALGILISMFTAITISRTLLRSLVGTKLAHSEFLMGTPKSGHPTFKIVQNRKIWFGLSGILLLASITLIPTNGLKLGLDFTGGTFMELDFENEISSQQLEELKEIIANVETELLTQTEGDVDTPEIDAPVLEEGGTALVAATEEEIIEVDFGTPQIVETGEGNIQIRMKHISNESHEALLQGFETELGSFEETRFNTIGPTIGSSLKQKAIVALIVALVMIVLYIAFAFRSIPREMSAWRFGAAAIAALAHDVLITLGAFVILGATLGVEIDALFITALLTIMGFSVHDTIVTFDRIRENLKNQSAHETFETVANRAVNETLARSINTSFSTLITIAVLFVLGAASIHWFLFALIIGLIAGTYSSIFVATPLLVWWQGKKKD